MTARFEIELKDAGKIERYMAKVWKQRFNKALEAAARKSRPVLWARQADAPPASDSPRSRPNANDTGAMAKSWEVITDPGSLSVMIYNQRPYAGYVEEGVPATATRIGRLGQQLIESWLLRKGIIIYRGMRQLSSAEAAKTIVFAMHMRDPWRLKPREIAKRAAPRVQQIFEAELIRARDKLIEEAKNYSKTAISRGAL